MENQEIKKIKKWLPRGYGKKIQTVTGKSLSHIYQVVGGHVPDDEVLEALVNLAWENKNKIKELKKIVSSL